MFHLKLTLLVTIEQNVSETCGALRNENYMDAIIG